MDDEKALVDKSMEIFRRIRGTKDGAVNAALAGYVEIMPDPLLKGMAQHKARQYLRQRAERAPLTNQEMLVLSAQISQQILNELIQKTMRKPGTVNNDDLDGAELFYRRALNHISMERYSDAERLLRRSVEICPDFADGWDVLIEVLEHNGKIELAEQARLRVRELNTKI